MFDNADFFWIEIIAILAILMALCKIHQHNHPFGNFAGIEAFSSSSTSSSSSSPSKKNQGRIRFLKDDDIYDDFYVQMYDILFYNKLKNDFEMKAIQQDTLMNTETSRILDAGCGTGSHVAAFLELQYKQVTGIDKNKYMIQRCKDTYPQYHKHFLRKNAFDPNSFHPDSFTHILCLYFTIYEWNDKTVFFENCHRWLLPKGYLIVHLVDPEKFNPIVPASMPYLLVTPQTFASERMTKSKVYFDKYYYEADFELQKDRDRGMVTEKFKNRDDRKYFRKHERTWFMESVDYITTLAKKAGLRQVGIIDLVGCVQEYQYLYIFQK